MSSFSDRHRELSRRRQDVAERTKQRRAAHGCTEEEVQRFKAMRDMGLSFAAIAELERKEEVDVMLALAATRSPNPGSGRSVVNTDSEGIGMLMAKMLPGEARGAAFKRVLREHDRLERLPRWVERLLRR